jgi:hypothetical protein
MLFLVNPAPFFIIYFALKYKHLSRNKQQKQQQKFIDDIFYYLFYIKTININKQATNA